MFWMMVTLPPIAVNTPWRSLERKEKKQAATGETMPHDELVNEEAGRVLTMDWRGCQCYIKKYLRGGSGGWGRQWGPGMRPNWGPLTDICNNCFSIVTL